MNIGELSTDLVSLDRDARRAVAALDRFRAKLATREGLASAKTDAGVEEVRHVAGQTAYRALTALEPAAHEAHLKDGLLRWVHELVQARRLRAAAEAGPVERLAAAAAYVELFFAETVEHFRREEEAVFPLYAVHAGADDPLLARILREHMELHGLARRLRAEVAAEDARADTLRELGTLLADHVRLEERELFEAIQATVPATELDTLLG